MRTVTVITNEERITLTHYSNINSQESQWSRKLSITSSFFKKRIMELLISIPVAIPSDE